MRTTIVHDAGFRELKMKIPASEVYFGGHDEGGAWCFYGGAKAGGGGEHLARG